MDASLTNPFLTPDGRAPVDVAKSPTIDLNDAQALVDPYSQDFPIHQPSTRLRTREVILITGSTGGIGTYLLHDLLLDDRVERVYALNRGNAKKSLFARQTEAFVDRGVAAEELKSPKLRLLEADVSAQYFGLGVQTYEEIRMSISTIIHVAWPVKFSLPLSSLTPNILATRQLIDLALTARGPRPARLVFISSIGTVMNWPSVSPVPEKPFPSLVIARKEGYSQSKWVAERVLQAAAEQRGLRATIWRVCALSGSTGNGAWNTTDFVPLLVKAGAKMGMLPSIAGAVGWVPIDEGARMIADDIFVQPAGASPDRADNLEYLNLFHPRPTEWDNIFSVIVEEVQCNLVPVDEWLDRFAKTFFPTKDKDQVGMNPLVQMLVYHSSFAATRADAHPEVSSDAGVKKVICGVALETRKAQQKSVTLERLSPLRGEDVRKWVAYWKRHGLFSGSANARL